MFNLYINHEKFVKIYGFFRSEFEGLDDNLRVEYEGYRPGMYVRIEVENVPCEFVEYFDPTYPVIHDKAFNDGANWREFYGDIEEAVPSNAPEP